MAQGAPVSVILPTVDPTTVVDEVTGQLDPHDELLIVCDRESDPIAASEPADERVRVIVAGEPDRCSGKANAIAAGMAAAENDLFVWTDDDFHHPPDWLDRMRADYARHGPITELPFFRGRDPLSVLLEPLYSVVAPFGIHWTDDAWGGAVAFHADDLDPDRERFLADLRHSMSDDGELSETVDVTAVKRVRSVDVGGTIRVTLERHVRFIKIAARYGPGGAMEMLATTVLLVALSVLVPLYAGAAFTLGIGAIYAAYGVRRWTFLLALPSVVASLPLLVYAIWRPTFVWGGRRYRWSGRYDVEVLDRG